MPTNQLYHTWIQRIVELRPGQRITPVRNFVWLIIGIYQSRSVSLSRIASKISSTAQLYAPFESIVGKSGGYEPIARSWLAQQAAHLQQVILIVDGTKVGFAHQL